MFLNKIVQNKKNEIARDKKRRPFAALKKEAVRHAAGPHRFLKALRIVKGIAVIAELKRKSPSKGILRKHFDPVKLAREFERAGAVALSVLTDKKYFGGSSAILKKVRRATRLPILRKDFILDAYQVYEARAMGADAILLIAAILTEKELLDLSALAKKLGLDVLFEVHTARDIKKVLLLKPALIGINNRDLMTFQVDLETTRRLIKKISKGVLIVSESGIKNATDLAQVRRWGADAVLIGEGLIGTKGFWPYSR